MILFNNEQRFLKANESSYPNFSLQYQNLKNLTNANREELIKFNGQSTGENDRKPRPIFMQAQPIHQSSGYEKEGWPFAKSMLVSNSMFDSERTSGELKSSAVVPGVNQVIESPDPDDREPKSKVNLG